MLFLMMIPLACNASYATDDQLNQLIVKTKHKLGRGSSLPCKSFVPGPVFKRSRYNQDLLCNRQDNLDKIVEGISLSGLQVMIEFDDKVSWRKIGGTRKELVKKALELEAKCIRGQGKNGIKMYIGSIQDSGERAHGFTSNILVGGETYGKKYVRYYRPDGYGKELYAHIYHDTYRTISIEEFQENIKKAGVTKGDMESILLREALKEYKRQSQKMQVPAEHIKEIQEKIPQFLNELLDDKNLSNGEMKVEGGKSVNMQFITIEQRYLDYCLECRMRNTKWEEGECARESLRWLGQFSVGANTDRALMMEYGNEINGSLYIVHPTHMLRITPKFGFDFSVWMNRERMLYLIENYKSEPKMRLARDEEEQKMQTQTPKPRQTRQEQIKAHVADLKAQVAAAMAKNDFDTVMKLGAMLKKLSSEL